MIENVSIVSLFLLVIIGFIIGYTINQLLNRQLIIFLNEQLGYFYDMINGNLTNNKKTEKKHKKKK